MAVINIILGIVGGRKASMNKWNKIAAIMAVAAFSLMAYQTFAVPYVFPTKPELAVQITTERGILNDESSHSEYMPRGVIKNAYEHETFSLTITNEGDASAHNVVVRLNTSGWIDFNDVVYGETLKRCPEKVGQCRFAVIPNGNSESVEFYVTISPQNYEKVINSREVPAIVFTITYDESSEAIEKPIKLIFRH